MIKCTYCNNEATHRRTVDLDIKGIPLCDSSSCFATMYIQINEGIKKDYSNQ